MTVGDSLPMGKKKEADQLFLSTPVINIES